MRRWARPASAERARSTPAPAAAARATARRASPARSAARPRRSRPSRAGPCSSPSSRPAAPEPQRPAPGGPAPPWAEPVLDEGQPQSRSQPRAEPPPPSQARRLGRSGARRAPEPGLHPGAAGPAARHADAAAAASREPRRQDFSSVTAFVNSLPAEDEVAPPVQVAPPVRTAPARTRTAAARPTPRAGARQPHAARRPIRAGSGCRWRPATTGPAWSINSAPFRRAGPGSARRPRRLYGAVERDQPPARRPVRQRERGAAPSSASWRASNVQAYTWTSEAGQEIDALQGANDSRTPTRTAQETRQPSGSRSARNRAGRERPATSSPAPAAPPSASSPPPRSRSGRARARARPRAARQEAARSHRPLAHLAADPRQQPGTTTRRRRSN